ncbi:MAG: MoaD/ThiS family protein [Candidatus Freyarchaeota archaeon]|nr:MoaD/ThiS family protein [Candidatus Jordarchaeia archaeon]MBS7269213.1 MoaD/ThiS family protein [Candidatus Jordarchaeia archaeon]MBS7279238.1 MoaD/ThiS family protein [Candidatus Jordarchaeia archaeon]
MRVLVKYYGVIKELAGTSLEEYDLPHGSSLKDLMNLIVNKHKGDGLYDRLWDEKENELKPLVMVVVDGEDPVEQGGYDRVKLKEGSKVELTMAFAGG